MRRVVLRDVAPSVRRAGRRTLVQAVLVAAALLVAYFLLPMDRPFSGASAAWLVIGLLLVATLLGWQVRLIAHAPYPRLQALKAFAMTVPLFLILFATAYYLIGYSNPSTFNEHITRADSLYFTVTVFSSVGFGDIVPVSESARILVMVQMVLDLVVLGAAARIVIDAVRQGLSRRDAPGDGAEG